MAVGLGRIAALLGGLTLLAACGGDVARSDLPLEDDFSGGCSWSEDNDENISLGCEDGEYRVRYKRTDERINHVIPKRIEQPVDSAAVEADATLAAFPDGSAADGQFHGVFCIASAFDEPSQGYMFVVSPIQKAIAILKVDETDQSLREQYYMMALVDEESDAVAGVGGTNRIRGECISTGDGVDLTMSLDGKKVAEAHDSKDFGAYDGFGLFTLSTRPRADIRFDDFRVEEVSANG